ncbi:hypothetical protein AB3N04_00770 (plasmid) [Alkalihalophilus sp. As8PL]|uniref:Uncharacterized protein n=1 Tax=Alkalihalophilus sp. As8PL TaxID=3237103 RepID=A0AB39BMV5_9BACI
MVVANKGLINQFKKEEVKVLSTKQEIHDPQFPTIEELKQEDEGVIAPVVICDQNGGFYIKIKEEWIEKNSEEQYTAYYVNRYAF